MGGMQRVDGIVQYARRYRTKMIGCVGNGDRISKWTNSTFCVPPARSQTTCMWFAGADHAPHMAGPGRGDALCAGKGKNLCRSARVRQSGDSGKPLPPSFTCELNKTSSPEQSNLHNVPAHFKLRYASRRGIPICDTDLVAI